MGEAADDLIESGMFYEDEDQSQDNVEYRGGFPMHRTKDGNLVHMSSEGAGAAIRKHNEELERRQKMKFKVHYDDQPNDGVDRLASILKENFGIIVTQLDGGDGFEEYEVTKDKDDERV